MICEILPPDFIINLYFTSPFWLIRAKKRLNRDFNFAKRMHREQQCAEKLCGVHPDPDYYEAVRCAIDKALAVSVGLDVCSNHQKRILSAAGACLSNAADRTSRNPAIFAEPEWTGRLFDGKRNYDD